MLHLAQSSSQAGPLHDAWSCVTGALCKGFCVCPDAWAFGAAQVGKRRKADCRQRQLQKPRQRPSMYGCLKAMQRAGGLWACPCAADTLLAICAWRVSTWFREPDHAQNSKQHAWQEGRDWAVPAFGPGWNNERVWRLGSAIRVRFRYLACLLIPRRVHSRFLPIGWLQGILFVHATRRVCLLEHAHLATLAPPCGTRRCHHDSMQHSGWSAASCAVHALRAAKACKALPECNAGWNTWPELAGRRAHVICAWTHEAQAHPCACPWPLRTSSSKDKHLY